MWVTVNLAGWEVGPLRLELVQRMQNCKLYHARSVARVRGRQLELEGQPS